jgi:hypothetical protein|tara:strand:+ start:367 stop:780 length:414 start_codon:yes stop_codon:yes gene_type:complete
MLKGLLQLLGLNNEGKSSAGEFAKDIREALKGKEIDPNRALDLIEVQTKLNETEAQHRTVFVAGWRPFIGWILGFSLGVYYIPQFAMASYLWVKMCMEANSLLDYPKLNVDSLFELVLGMLGLAAIRTYEKVKGKTK